jgi:hypothetical protein
MRRLPFWGFMCVTIAGCGGSGAGGAPATQPDEPAVGPPRSPDSLADATVYDAKGQAATCGLPEDGCPKAKPNREFLDKCRLRGYQVRRCGCETVCSGNVMVSRPHYDAEGNEQECQPEDPECTPPDTSAAFQDACADAHHRLVMCGCEWLCDGPPKR